DALIVPSWAKGAYTMSNNAGVPEFVEKLLAEGKIVGMISAGDLTALTAKLPRQPLTSHPSVKSYLDNEFEYSEDPVVVSSKLVASRGPGTAFPFALTLVEMLCGVEKHAEVHAPMVFPAHTPL
ncbi:class I glutamine amidotransferase-like protein, partial [Mycena rosella]